MNTTLNHNGEKELDPRLHGEAVAANPVASPRIPGKDNRDTARASESPRGIAGKLFIGILVALVVVGVLLFQRSRAQAELKTSTLELAVPTVSTVAPKAGPATTEIVLPGSLTAYSETPIYARTNGYVKSWSTDIGAKVKAGDVMAELEAPDVDAQMRQATANVTQARANLEIAKLNFNREQDLLKTKVISQQEFDQSRTNMEAIDPATRTLNTEVQVPNADGRLFPGAYANVHLILPLKNVAQIIPVNTVIFRGEHTQVGVVDASNVAHLKNVVLGRDFGTSFEVTSGIDSKDRLIVNPSDSLADGTNVHVQETPAAAQAKP